MSVSTELNDVHLEDNNDYISCRNSPGFDVIWWKLTTSSELCVPENNMSEEIRSYRFDATTISILSKIIF